MDAERALTRVGALSILAALMHAALTPAHFDEWWGYGVFFLFVTPAQAVYGAIPLFTRMLEGEGISQRWPAAKLRAYVWAGTVGNLAIVALYVVTRSVGIPFFGPAAGAVEEVRALDVVSTLVELVLVALLVAMLRAPRKDEAASRTGGETNTRGP